MKPQLIRATILSCQACVPKEFTDKQIIDFAEEEYPCGTTNGWFIRKNGKEPEKVPCDNNKETMVHVVLDA